MPDSVEEWRNPRTLGYAAALPRQTMIGRTMNIALPPPPVGSSPSQVYQA